MIDDEVEFLKLEDGVVEDESVVDGLVNLNVDFVRMDFEQVDLRKRILNQRVFLKKCVKNIEEM